MSTETGERPSTDATDVGNSLAVRQTVGARRFLWWNVMWLVLLTFGIYYWLSTFSDLLDNGGPLILVAVLAALSMIWGWLPEKITKPAVAEVQRLLFENSRVAVALPWVFVGLLAFSLCWGTIELQSSATTFEQDVKIKRVGSCQNDDYSFPRTGHKRINRCLLFRSRDFVVTADGLPSLKVALWPWTKQVLRADTFYRKPVVLLLPTSDIASAAKENAKRLVFEINGATCEIDSYRGTSVWIGAQEGLRIPQWVERDWAKRIEFAVEKADKKKRLKEYEQWLKPVYIDRDSCDQPIVLKDQMQITVSAFTPKSDEPGVPSIRAGEPRTFTVRRPMNREDFPQRVIFAPMPETEE